MAMAELQVTGEQTWESLRKLLAPWGCPSRLSRVEVLSPFLFPLLASLTLGSCLALASSSQACASSPTNWAPSL